MAEKYTYCPRCSQPLEDDGTCPGCTYGHKRNQSRSQTINPECPWNDHGIRCGKIGSLSDSTNGAGPWYCATHYWKLKDWPVKKSDAPGPSYRERWYADRGLPYEPPNLAGTAHFQPVANMARQLHDRLVSGELGPRHREPGEDTREDIGEELQG